MFRGSRRWPRLCAPGTGSEPCPKLPLPAAAPAASFCVLPQVQKAFPRPSLQGGREMGTVFPSLSQKLGQELEPASPGRAAPIAVLSSTNGARDHSDLQEPQSTGKQSARNFALISHRKTILGKPVEVKG